MQKKKANKPTRGQITVRRERIQEHSQSMERVSALAERYAQLSPQLKDVVDSLLVVKAPEATLDPFNEGLELLQAARAAAFEVDSFTNMYRSMTAINGALTLLITVFDTDNGNPPKGMDWSSVAYLLEECKRRGESIQSAASHLEQFDRARDAARQDAELDAKLHATLLARHEESAR